MAIFPNPFLWILTFPFILACILYPTFTCRIDLSKTDTYPINPYPEWLGVVVKAEGYGSVRCRVLNGSKGSFPFVLGRLNYPAYPSLLTYIFLDFFQTVPIPFLSFFLGGPRTCRGLNHPRLCPKTIWTCIIYPWL